MVQLTEQEYQRITGYIRQKYGINLEKKQYLIEGKLWTELERYHLDSFGEYWKLLCADQTGAMERRMLDLLTTNYTYFFREEKHFEFLEKEVLPRLGRRPFSVWCAGCATGQECYTLAMYLLDCQAEGLVRQPFRIIGVDVSEQAIATAQKGIYSSTDIERLPAMWQERYCQTKEDGTVWIRSQARQPVMFQRFNLMDAPIYPQRYELVFCRNVLIYFREEERRQILRRLKQALVPGGYLLIGHTESLIGCEEGLEYVQPSIYRRPGGTAR